MTSGLAVWNSATQVSWAVAIEDAPIPVSVPLRFSEPEPAGAGVPDSLAAQAEKVRATVAVSAAAAPLRENFTDSPSSMSWSAEPERLQA